MPMRRLEFELTSAVARATVWDVEIAQPTLGVLWQNLTVYNWEAWTLDFGN